METQPKNRINKLLQRLKIKHRLVLMNDDTYEEKFSASLTPLNVFVVGVSGVFLLIFLTTYLIAFTNLKEYIPGYSNDVTIRRKLMNVNTRLDSLQEVMTLKDEYLNNILQVAQGTVKRDANDYKRDSAKNYEGIKLSANADDAKLRKELESNENNYSLNVGSDVVTNDLKELLFFKPLAGIVTDKYKSTHNHYGIDIVAQKNEAVKATLSGTVLIANWTLETGYVIQLQHSNDIISVYKHNATLLKKVGDKVKVGEAIAIVGNSGEHSTGPHLHFEIWRKGEALNPAKYISF
ncbi:MAG: M23 family metallopeptidase [Bacteroidia bacterium]|nr:M23 family metallopeptidase [Bacteroidia bacterium]